VRDSAYLRESWPEYEQMASERNDDIGVFHEAIDFLVEQGFKVFRMGAKVDKPLKFAHPKVFDYATNGMRSELRDVYLFRRSSIVVSNDTGGDHLAHTFRKPLVHACQPNYKELDCIRNLDRLFFSLKLAYDTSTGERLALSTVLGRLREIDETDFFLGIRQCAVELRSNSPREIRSLVEEALIKTVSCGQEKEARWTEGQGEFWRNYDLIRNCVFSDASARARIGSNFYRSNYRWLV
jgi:putative glycosyltransferase (TIGR04372 family)